MRLPSRRPGISLGLLVAAVLTVTPLAAGGLVYVNPTPDPPERSDAGDWPGTWFYASRERQLALWIRIEDGQPRLKLRSLNVDTGEGFETDWSGGATYSHDGWPGEFSFEITVADENLIEGRWSLSLTRESTTREESGRVTLYRAGDGRQAAWVFSEFERTFTGKEGPRAVPGEHFWGFRKLGQRLARWEELPF